MKRNYAIKKVNTKYKALNLLLFLLFFTITSFSYSVKAQTSDLSITKSVNNNTPFIGDAIVFTIIITNNGPDIASGIAVLDKVPSGYGSITNISNGGATNGNNINWTGLIIPPNSSVVLTLNVTVLPIGNYNNRAEIIASNNTDPDSDPTSSFDVDDLNDTISDDDESDLVIVTPIFRSDLSLTNSVDNLTPKVGDAITFTITLKNDGPEDASGVSVEDVIQDGFSIVNISSGGSAIGNTISWENLSIPAGNEIVLTVTVEVLALGNYTHQAEINTSDNVDVDSDPNSSFDVDDLNDGLADDDETELIDVMPIAVSDLSLEKIVDILEPNKGTEVVFTLIVNNDGISDASNVSVRDQLPQGFIWITDDSFGDYDPTTGIWFIGSLPNGGSASLNITAIVNVVEGYTNEAEIITSNSFDPDSTVDNKDPLEDDMASVTLNPKGLLIPEGFSPNGDTINDTFEIPGLGYLFPNFEMEIYNRWGNKVFKYSNEGRNEPQWWTGNSDGRSTSAGNSSLPTGTYYYVLYFNQDNVEPLTDWIYLNR